MTESSGGASTGGVSLGAPSGGAPNSGGRDDSGGTSSGGNVEGLAPFILGADISSVQESGATFVDTDGQTKDIFSLLKNHGFNYVRLRTFVDPSAPYGYASTANGCPGKTETYGDKDHVVAFAREAKAHGMGFLLDFHYSDVWADPGNQIIPASWRAARTIEELASLLSNYTKDVLRSAILAGARPDIVQVGNEITPGLLAHLPGPDTDCYGNNPIDAPFGGSSSNWDHLALLLKAGVDAVREVDPTIEVLLHVENTSDVEGLNWWIENALSREVSFDILGLSCYVPFQGPPFVWQETFTALATRYPQLKFVIAEYNQERTQANLIMKALPQGRGLGTFFWEPTQGGEWGSALFTWQGNRATANIADFSEFDALQEPLGLLPQP